MNRLHVHLKVSDLDRSVAFYSALFGRAPDKRENDYAKWMLDDPRANIAISTRGGAAQIDHVGVEVDGRRALEDMAARLREAGAGLLEEADATCCYARSDKYWALSPDGAKWELYYTFADNMTYGSAPVIDAVEPESAPCCGVL